MKFTFDVRGDIALMMKEEVKVGQFAVTAAMNTAAVTLKGAIRQQVLSAGLGSRLAKSVRSAVYPNDQPSLNAASLVWTKAPEIMYANEKGAIIRAAEGAWMAIPTPAAGRGPGGRRLSPVEWERRRGLPLRFVFRPGLPSLLVADGRQNSKGLGVKSGSKTGRGRATVVIFILVPQVTLRKRLNVASLGEAVAGKIPALVVAYWGK